MNYEKTTIGFLYIMKIEERRFWISIIRILQTKSWMLLKQRIWIRNRKRNWSMNLKRKFICLLLNRDLSLWPEILFHIIDT